MKGRRDHLKISASTVSLSVSFFSCKIYFSFLFFFLAFLNHSRSQWRLFVGLVLRGYSE